MRRNFAAAAARFADGDLTPTVSIGVTLGVTAKSDVDTLLEIADRALYRAKANGRNRVEATAPLDEIEAPFARAPSIVPLIGAERADIAVAEAPGGAPARGDLSAVSGGHQGTPIPV